MNKLVFNNNDYKISVIGISLKNNDFICINTNSGTITDLFEDLYIDEENEEYKTEVFTEDRLIKIYISSYSPNHNDNTWIPYAQKIINMDTIKEIQVYHTEETQ